ncbi:MAG: hypothetical protein R3E01_25765 [Pirellulaceae bacterium]|nr:hypothetical protein [Planctomycetales bacterium]
MTQWTTFLCALAIAIPLARAEGVEPTSPMARLPLPENSQPPPESSRLVWEPTAFLDVGFDSIAAPIATASWPARLDEGRAAELPTEPSQINTFTASPADAALLQTAEASTTTGAVPLFAPPPLPDPARLTWENNGVGPVAALSGPQSSYDADASAYVESNTSYLFNDIVLPEYARRSLIAGRLGVWSVDDSGSPVKIGEYQSLKSSVFLDLDGLISDGVRTWDFVGTFLDNDASKIKLNYFGPSVSTRFDYDRYLRRLDRDPLDGYVDFDQQPPLPLPPAPENFRDMREDQTVGEDFAIRVEELNGSIRGNLTSHVDWRLNVWAMRKHGERQATAMAHCFTAPNAVDTNGNSATGVACHVLNQRQRIDWLTTEVQPVFEGHYGPLTAQYSHTLRILGTDDQLVTRPYDNFGITGDQPYGVVPENVTNIDRLRLSSQLGADRDVYVNILAGSTENRVRDTNRRFHGFDLRLSDRSIENLTITGNIKKYVQTGQFPPSLAEFETASAIRVPINYDRTSAGFDATWRPLADESLWASNLRLTWGYEYREIQRENAVFVEQNTTFNQSGTQTNNVFFRAAKRWTTTFDSSLGYRISFINDPLYAISTNATTNTSLPTTSHRVDLRSSWAPAPSLLFTSQVGIINSQHHSDVTNFTEDNYDLVFTSWYAPLPRWSLSSAIAFYSNWIDQDITLGTRSSPLTLPWDYGGRSELFNLGTTYAWSEKIALSATVDFVNARNAFDDTIPWPDIPYYSDVIVETLRFGGGVDYCLGPNASCYVRYQTFDYDDQSSFLDGGRVKMLLFGGTAVF